MKAAMREVLPWIDSESGLPPFIVEDTTPRDGFQSQPWFRVPSSGKRSVLAAKTADLGVHHLETSSGMLPGDPETEAGARVIRENADRDAVFFNLARLKASDIEVASQIVQPAKYGGIHTFIGTSPQHLDTFNFGSEEIIRNTKKLVQDIRNKGLIAQFSAEDATRTEWDFLYEVYKAAVDNGAQIINVPDTVGFFNPDQYCALLLRIKKAFPGVVLSTHAHNDMGQAEMNALLPLTRGLANRVEGTLYGIGERAGNTDWPALIHSIYHRYPELAKNLLSNPENLGDLLTYMSEITGLYGRPVMPGYGFQALVNRSGIHQRKMAETKGTYVWNTGIDFGLGDRPFYDLNHLSGLGGAMAKLSSLGIQANQDQGRFMIQLYRFMFSPDTTVDSIMASLPALPGDFRIFLTKAALRIEKVRTEAMMLVNSPANNQRWMNETDQIVANTFHAFYSVDQS